MHLTLMTLISLLQRELNGGYKGVATTFKSDDWVYISLTYWRYINTVKRYETIINNRIIYVYMYYVFEYTAYYLFMSLLKPLTYRPETAVLDANKLSINSFNFDCACGIFFLDWWILSFINVFSTLNIYWTETNWKVTRFIKSNLSCIGLNIVQISIF